LYATHTHPTARAPRQATERDTRARAITRPLTSEQLEAARLSSPDAGYELFRRAIILRDADAWLEIAARYRPMLISWASQCSAIDMAREHCDDIADRALARAWAALTPERFAQFPSLAALMAYLRTCVTATAIDAARSEIARERTQQRMEIGDVATPEQLVLDEIDRCDLWRAVLGAVRSARERIVLVESFQLDLPPRTILARHPNLFDNVGAVYLAKRHLLARLQRNPEVRRFIR